LEKPLASQRPKSSTTLTASCITRYDAPETLFFVDPPYCGTEGYTVDFPRDHYSELAARLRDIKGKFMLTINDHPLIRQTFAAFHVKQLKTRYTVQGAKRAESATELLYTNFET
jgi:DNA adenine methylase